MALSVSFKNHRFSVLTLILLPWIASAQFVPSTNMPPGAQGAWSFPLPEPMLSAAGALNGASLLPGIASATWFSVFGTNLSRTTRIWRPSDETGNLLPTQLDGVSVSLNGKPAPVYYVSSTQINALAPDDATVGTVEVTVTTPQGRNAPVLAVKRPFAPAWFVFDAEQRKYVAAEHPDGVLVSKPTLYPGVVLRPARPGDVVSLYGTGFGPTSPPTPASELVTQPRILANWQIEHDNWDF